MRKVAPAFILTTLVALASGSAFALGDMNKDKKSPTAGTATPGAQQGAGSASSGTVGSTRSGSAALGTTGTAGSGAAAASGGGSAGMGSNLDGARAGTSGAGTASTQGSAVSSVARDKDASGREQGEAVSSTARTNTPASGGASASGSTSGSTR